MNNLNSLERQALILAKTSSINMESYNYMTNFWANFYLYLGITNTIFATIASASSLSEIVNSTKIVSILTAFVAVLSAISIFINPMERFNQHRKAKESFMLIYAKADRLLNTFRGLDSIEYLQEFQKGMDDLYQQREALINSPPLAEWVHKIGGRRSKEKYKELWGRDN